MANENESLPSGVLLDVCRLHSLLPAKGSVGLTAIDKRPVDGPIYASRFGLYADIQASREHHGGVDKALYAYSSEDAEWWSAQLSRPIPPGLFGENLRTKGIPVSGATIGERWQVGSVELTVTQPRTPCATFAARMNDDAWVPRFTEANRTGAYLAVHHIGVLTAGDEVRVMHRPAHGVTIDAWFAAYTMRQADSSVLADLAERLLVSHAAGETYLADQMITMARAALLGERADH